jgi:hypothetical protein
MGAAPAGAATTFGADVDNLAASSVINCGNCITVGLVHSDGTPEIGSPASGVLTKVRIRYQAPASAGSIRVLHQLTPPAQFRNDGEQAISVPAESVIGGSIVSFPVRLKIAAGDRVGVGIDSLAYFSHPDPDAACASEAYASPFPVGGTFTYSPGACGSYEILEQGTVEADADGDGFGDETQDLCPTDPTRQSACAVVKKCKKKKAKQKSADAAKKHKKKCKKRKKKK